MGSIRINPRVMVAVLAAALMGLGVMTASPAFAATSTGDAVKVAAKFTGGKPGKADPSKSAITFGWANQDSGSLENLPHVTRAISAGVKFINNELGGIDGHPLKMVSCATGANDERGKSCAQKFLNDKNIKFVMTGYQIVGQPAFMAALAPNKQARKPHIGTVPFTERDGSTKGTYYLGPGRFIADNFITFYRDVWKIKSLANIWPNDPAYTSTVTAQEKQQSEYGLKVGLGLIPANGTDAVGPIVASNAKDYAALSLNLTGGPQCIAVAKALQQLKLDGKKSMGFSTCLTDAVKKALGDYPKWTYTDDAFHPDVKEPTGQTAAFNAIIRKYDGKNASATIHGYKSNTAFGVFMTTMKWLNAMGPNNVTSAGFRAQATKFRGPIWMGPSKARFGSANGLKFGTSPLSSVASVGSKFYHYLGGGKWQDMTPGRFVGQPGPPPKS